MPMPVEDTVQVNGGLTFANTHGQDLDALYTTLDWDE